MKFLLLLCLLPFVALAQGEPSVGDLVSMIVDAIKAFKAEGWQVGLSLVIVFLVSSLKNSYLRQYVWDKLGAYKVFVAPVLALCAVALEAGKLGWKEMAVALITGAGAIAIHQILDGLKDMPWVGPKYVWLVDLVGKLLKKPTA